MEFADGGPTPPAPPHAYVPLWKSSAILSHATMRHLSADLFSMLLAGDLAALIKQRKTDNAIVPQQEAGCGEQLLARSQKAMDIFAQCCFALQMIHCQHILHRDRSFWESCCDEVVKLGDFGALLYILHHFAHACLSLSVHSAV
eukprot:804368-Amphidinium_carterae.1